jgi:hypothetical protein
MNDDERRLDGLSAEERALEDHLSRLGGLLRELRRAETEADSAFTRTLRAHLLHGEDLAPHPTFARRLRARLLGPRGARPVPRPRRRFTTWLPVLAALIALAGLVLTRLPTGSSFPAPTASRADLVFNLPGVAGSVTAIGPTVSGVRRSSAALFTGPLHLVAPRLAGGGGEARAYRLRAEPNAARRARRVLRIEGRVHRLRAGGARWLVASDGGNRPHSLHSVAVSLATGELIYHDRRNYVLPRSAHALGKGTAVSVARHWLGRLGWPGESMPVRDIGLVRDRPKVRRVVLGWPGVRNAAIEAAVLWVTPDHSVIEADVWPRVTASGSISIRSPADAWADVSSHKAPVAVRGAAHDTGTLRGRVRRASRVLILVPGGRGTLYLVPAYEFRGTGRIGGAPRSRQWVSLARGR